jgi:hypothetical protein
MLRGAAAAEHGHASGAHAGGFVLAGAAGVAGATGVVEGVVVVGAVVVVVGVVVVGVVVVVGALWVVVADGTVVARKLVVAVVVVGAVAVFGVVVVGLTRAPGRLGVAVLVDVWVVVVWVEVGALYLPTTIVTVVPNGTTVLALGIWAITMPSWFAAVTVWKRTAALSLSTSNVPDAATSVSPVTDGTFVVVGALATVRVTREPGLATELPAGVWLRTVPAEAVSVGLLTTFTANLPSTAWAAVS